MHHTDLIGRRVNVRAATQFSHEDESDLCGPGEIKGIVEAPDSPVLDVLLDDGRRVSTLLEYVQLVGQ